jgi:rod shape-determining protein MreD
LIEPAKLGLLLLLVVALQAVLTSRFSVLGVTADLFVVAVVLVSLSHGSFTGAVFGFSAGLLADVVYLDIVGVRALLYLLAGLAVGRFMEHYGPVTGWMVVLVAAITSLLCETTYGIFQFVLGAKVSFFVMLRIQILPAALINGLLSAPLYAGLARTRLLPHPDTKPSFR